VKLVVGLGNPGPRYAGTRHNVGFRVVEAVAARHRIELSESHFDGRFGCAPAGGLEDRRLAVLEPETFMNRSGSSVAEAVGDLELDPSRDLLVVFDDVDLPFGRLRMRGHGGDGGHNGLGDVLTWLETRDVPRLRVGVGRADGPMDTRDWVLGGFSAEEEAALPDLLERAADAIDCFVAEGVVAAMNRFNAA
jgi:PTH1 family peptidyl-tRNA hydrolase